MVTVSFVEHGDEGDEIEHELPGKREVCSRCNGEGKHVNPAVDGNGISPQEFAEDFQFEEDYFAGVYDVTCETCKGLRVVTVVDEEAAKKNCPELLKKYLKHQQEEYEYEKLCRSERMMGA